jgi:hypothetical protein
MYGDTVLMCKQNKIPASYTAYIWHFYSQCGWNEFRKQGTAAGISFPSVSLPPLIRPSLYVSINLENQDLLESKSGEFEGGSTKAVALVAAVLTTVNGHWLALRD